MTCFAFFAPRTRTRISGWRGVFTKLEYLILNHSGHLEQSRNHFKTLLDFFGPRQ
jgi:hypothetical protein